MLGRESEELASKARILLEYEAMGMATLASIEAAILLAGPDIRI
jgi:hypothetical protein